uniref:Uncharacterized protein n=1 Tax=uncultured marine virus TaxID=186617 RepID=A0A0F7L869_9VIRU|nr:hypothetical protein [uncultured marine virus]
MALSLRCFANLIVSSPMPPAAAPGAPATLMSVIAEGRPATNCSIRPGPVVVAPYFLFTSTRKAIICS